MSSAAEDRDEEDGREPISIHDSEAAWSVQGWTGVSAVRIPSARVRSKGEAGVAMVLVDRVSLWLGSPFPGTDASIAELFVLKTESSKGCRVCASAQGLIDGAD